MRITSRRTCTLKCRGKRTTMGFWAHQEARMISTLELLLTLHLLKDFYWVTLQTTKMCLLLHQDILSSSSIVKIRAIKAKRELKATRVPRQTVLRISTLRTKLASCWTSRSKTKCLGKESFHRIRTKMKWLSKEHTTLDKTYSTQDWELELPPIPLFQIQISKSYLLKIIHLSRQLNLPTRKIPRYSKMTFPVIPGLIVIPVINLDSLRQSQISIEAIHSLALEVMKMANQYSRRRRHAK